MTRWKQAIFARILNLGTRQRQVVRLTPDETDPTHYAGGLGGPKSQSRRSCQEKIGVCRESFSDRIITTTVTELDPIH